MHPNLLASISILLWCLSGACFRMGSELMPPMLYLALITGAGAAVALLLQVCSGRPVKHALQIPVRVAIAGSLGVAVYTILLALAFSLAPERDIGTVNLINYLWPVWIVLLQLLLLPARQRWLPLIGGVLLGFSGLLIAAGWDIKATHPERLLPFLLAGIGGILWALYTVLLKKWNIPDSQGGTTFHFTTCALLALALHLMLPSERQSVEWSAPLIFWIALGAIGPVGTAYYLWELAVKRGNPGFIAALSYFIPIGSSLILGLIFRETLTPGLIPGALLIATGAWIVSKATPPDLRSDG
jgi:drug/metabolite transporter (DMT)-like permease